MFANTKLKTRMLLGYAVPAIVYMGFAALVYSTANKGFTTFSDVERVHIIIKIRTLLRLNSYLYRGNKKTQQGEQLCFAT
jgi:hypothetical protein